MRYHFLICWLLLSSVSLNLLAAPTIIWPKHHWAPLMMQTDPNKAPGRFDQLIDLYIKSLPMYKHKIINMNWSRVWMQIKSGAPVCNIAALRTTERESFALFSLPNSIAIPNKVIVKDSLYQQWRQPQSISLNALTRNPQYKLIYEKERSYSNLVDSILSVSNSSPSVESRNVNSAQLIKMLVYNRIDYMIEYENVARYHVQNIEFFDDKPTIRSISIEGHPEYYLGYIACPKTNWGRQTIQDLNKLLTKIRPSKAYRLAHKAWAASEKEAELLDRLFSKHILKL
nr:TIGR02285 family protein [Catenovulum sediminis]